MTQHYTVAASRDSTHFQIVTDRILCMHAVTALQYKCWKSQVEEIRPVVHTYIPFMLL